MAEVKVLFDLNVILDVLQRREPFFESSSQALSLAESRVIKGYLSAHSVTTIMYLTAKDRSADFARVLMTSLLQFLSIIKVEQSTIEQALNLSVKDFEDAVQMIAALQAGADYLVTRNPADFRLSPVSVLQPAELIKIIPAS